MEDFMKYLRKELKEKKQKLEEKEQKLETLKVSIESNKDEIDKLKEEVKKIRKSIRDDECFIQTLAGAKDREQHLKEIETKIPKEIIMSLPYRNYMNNYLAQDSQIKVSEIKLLEDGKVFFKIGLDSEVDEGKAIMQLVDGHIYIYEETRGYEENEDGIKQELNRITISINKMNDTKSKGKKNFMITAILHEGKWLTNESQWDKKPKDEILSKWKKIKDISKFPTDEILSTEFLDEDVKQFFVENFTPIFEKGQEEKSLTELSEELAELTEKEKKAKELLEQYEQRFDRNLGEIK